MNKVTTKHTSFEFEVNLSSGNFVMFHVDRNFDFKFNVDWGDGKRNYYHREKDASTISHKYRNSGCYKVKISGDIYKLRFGVRTKGFITRVFNLGDCEWIDTSSMFENCEKLMSFAGGATDEVTDMSAMFAGCFSLVLLDLSTFNTSNVVSMDRMLEKVSFTPPLDLTSFDFSKSSLDRFLYLGPGKVFVSKVVKNKYFKGIDAVKYKTGTNSWIESLSN
jgi:surface protein